ncbi:hypothetical protein AAKU55_003055 [Oxalobacteraceae bacterium GrIS 1.11]
MRKIIGILGFIYVISAIVLVPMLINVAWQIAFAPNIDKIAALSGALKIITWLVAGIMVIKVLQTRSRAILDAKVRSVAPDNFRPRFELIGDYLTEYLGMAPQENRMVIVDLKQGVARCEPINFLQGWAIEERGTRTTLLIRFNDFSMPSVKFDIPRRSSDDIAAKLNYAMQS